MDAQLKVSPSKRKRSEEHKAGGVRRGTVSPVLCEARKAGLQLGAISTPAPYSSLGNGDKTGIQGWGPGSRTKLDAVHRD